jgi:hypothetical protein
MPLGVSQGKINVSEPADENNVKLTKEAIGKFKNL